MACNHKFIQSDSVAFKQKNGRNSLEYIRTDFFYCEKCLEQKEKTRKAEAFFGEEYGLPDWAKAISEYRENYNLNY